MPTTHPWPGEVEEQTVSVFEPNGKILKVFVGSIFFLFVVPVGKQPRVGFQTMPWLILVAAWYFLCYFLWSWGASWNPQIILEGCVLVPLPPFRVCHWSWRLGSGEALISWSSFSLSCLQVLGPSRACPPGSPPWSAWG